MSGKVASVYANRQDTSRAAPWMNVHGARQQLRIALEKAALRPDAERTICDPLREAYQTVCRVEAQLVALARKEG